MASINAIPDKGPISSADPYALLSRRRKGEGYDVGTPIQLGGDGNGEAINIWSRRKPMVPLKDGPGDLTEAQRKEVNYGLNLYYGDTQMTYPGGSGLVGLPGINSVDAPTELPKYLWKYDRQPGAGDWKRLTDWAGYSHVAAPPVSPAGDFILYNADTSLTIRADVTGIHATDNLRLADFPYLNDLYFCVLVYRRRKSTGAIETCGYATASTTIGEGGTSVTIKRTELTFTSATLYDTPQYILCAYTGCKPTFSAGEVSGVFMPLPSDTPLIGSIQIATGSEFKITPYAIGERFTTSGYDYARFLPMLDKGEYFGVQNGFWLFCEITSSDGTPISLPLSSVRVSILTSLGTTGMVAGNKLQMAPNAMYTQAYKGGAYTQYNTVTIPASGSIFVIFDISNMPFVGNDGTVMDSASCRQYGTFMGTIGRIGSSSQDYTGASTLNINIHDGIDIMEFEGSGNEDETV